MSKETTEAGQGMSEEFISTLEGYMDNPQDTSEDAGGWMIHECLKRI